MLEYQNIKLFLQNVTFQIDMKKFSRLKKISDLNGEEIIETFYEKELQKTNQKEFGVQP